MIHYCEDTFYHLENITNALKLFQQHIGDEACILRMWDVIEGEGHVDSISCLHAVCLLHNSTACACTEENSVEEKQLAVKNYIRHWRRELERLNTKENFSQEQESFEKRKAAGTSREGPSFSSRTYSAVIGLDSTFEDAPSLFSSGSSPAISHVSKSKKDKKEKEDKKNKARTKSGSDRKLKVSTFLGKSKK